MQRPDTIFVQPVEGVLVRHVAPRQGFVDAAGEDVPDSRYYRRRLKDGDLVRATRKRGAKAKGD